MKNEQILGALAEFGLNQKEAEVYLACLELGQTSILRIARQVDVKRTTIYSIIESLKNMGLISLEMKGFKTYYRAEDPSKLELLLEMRKERLKAVLPDLSALYNLKGGESTIKYFEGAEAVKSIYFGLLKELKRHDDYLIISNVDEWWKLDQDFLMKFTLERGRVARENDVKIRILLQDTLGAREYKANEKKYNVIVKILPANYALVTNLVVIPKKVVIHQLTAPTMAMVFENSSVVQLQRQLFEMIWNSLP